MINAITNYIVALFQKDELVNTITFKDNEVVDIEKENVLPLVSIRFTNRSEDPDNELYVYNYKIGIYQQRDTRKVVQPSKLMEDTNWIDNLAECESIANNFVNYIERIEIDENINIDSLSDLLPVSNYASSNLDGFSFDYGLSYPNTGYCGC